MRKAIPVIIAFFTFLPLDADEVRNFDEGWEYNWKRSIAMTSRKTSGKLQDDEWKPYSLKDQTPERQNRNILWLRHYIPKTDWEKSAIYFPFIEFTYQAFIQERLVAQFGDIHTDDTCSVDTWIQHQILSIPKNLEGEYLYLKVCSPYPSIGLVHIPKIGKYEDLYYNHIVSEIPLLLVSVFFITCSLISFYFFTRRVSQKLLLYFSFICLALCILSIYHTSFRLEIVNNRLFWTEFFILTALIFPFIMILFIENLIGYGWMKSLQFMRYAILLFFIIAAPLTLLRFDFKYQPQFAFAFFVFQLLNLFVVLLNCGIEIRKGNKDMYVLVGGFIALLLSLVPQVLYEIGIMKYQKFYFSGGFFVFTLGLGWIAGNKYSKVYDELQDYSTNLEKKIQERALQIEEGNKIALESTMKIAKLEKENAIIQEREKIFTDMHDHIGAALSDLTFQIRNVKESSKLDHVQNENLQSALEKVVQKFRSHLHAIEDMKVLESDFINGLRLIVLRRYEFSKRKFHFFSDASTVEFFIKHSSPSQKEALLAIVSEICTNDLKYGKNNSEIRFLKNKKNIEIYFFSETNHDTEIHLTGMGEKTIQNRVLELNGTIKTKTENHHFFLEIRLPMYI